MQSYTYVRQLYQEC